MAKLIPCYSTEPESQIIRIKNRWVTTAAYGLGVGSGEIIVTLRGPEGLIPVGRYMIAP